MIFAVIGGMLLHNFIIWRSKLLARRKRSEAFVTRMPLRFRWQHATLLTSFFLLVLTGFALKYPSSWFASTLILGERTRGILHRIAAVALIGVSVYHIFDIAFSREGAIARAGVPGTTRFGHPDASAGVGHRSPP